MSSRMFFVLTFFLLAIGQSSAQKIDVDNKICIKTNPLAFIDLFGGTSWRIGVEAKVYRNISASFEFGKYFAYNDNLMMMHTKGFTFRSDIKLYLNKHQETVGKFISLGYSYKEFNFDYEDSIKIGNDPVFQKHYHIQKTYFCFNAKYGELTTFSKHFVFEWYVGTGLRFYHSSNNLSKEEDKGLLTGEGHGDITGNFQRGVAEKILPDITLGIKLGYRIK